MRRRAAMALITAGALGLIAATMALAGSGSASAAPAGQFTSVTIGPAGYGGNAIAAGPDGNMWFTDNASNAIGRITPGGAVASFPVPTSTTLSSGPGLFSLAAGPDGNMWFTEFYGNMIGRITPAGEVTTFAVPTPAGAQSGMAPYGIAAGPDGNLWFTMDFANAIGRITPAGVITQFPIPAPGSSGSTPIVPSTNCVMCGYLITAGPDGALWFTIPSASRIGRITVDGVVTSYPVPTTPPAATVANPISVGDITAGSDGNLWFTEPNDNQVGRMTPAGAITEFSIPTSAATPTMMTQGPLGSLWLTEPGANALAQITVSGAITQVPIPTAGSDATDLAAGADGSMWFTNVVGAPPADVLQIASVGTGAGAILSAQVTGHATVGSPLTCKVSNTSGWAVSKVRFQWLRGGRAVSGQTGRTFTPDRRDVRATVACRVAVTYAPMLTQLGATSSAVRVQR